MKRASFQMSSGQTIVLGELSEAQWNGILAVLDRGATFVTFTRPDLGTLAIAVAHIVSYTVQDEPA